MKRDADVQLPMLLAVHAAIGACVGGVSGAVFVGTDVIGLAAIAQADPGGFILVPAFAGLFAVCAAASALDLLPPPEDEGPMPGHAIDRRQRAVRVRVPVRA